MQLPFSLQPLLDGIGQFLSSDPVMGPAYAFVLIAALIKIALILGGLLQIIPFIILLERKLIGWIQDRPGPNRAGPFGILHGILDGAKLFFKEEITPKNVDRPLFLLAPALVVIPAFLALCLVPVGTLIQGPHLDALASFFRFDPAVIGSNGAIHSIPLAITNPNIGILYVLAITSMGVYGITIAGWASNNKWSLLGGIRATAQMVSYEITLSLAVIGIVLLSGSLNLYDIIDGQAGGFWNWNVVAQPVAIMLFVVAMFAETNRLPFDLAEAEAELTGGFHTEYSSMRFALFFLGEYVNMIIVSAMCVTLFLGGFQGFVPMEMLYAGGWEGLAADMGNAGFVVTIISYLIGPMLWMPLKIGFFMILFIMARGTMPRFRYDQLMNLGWKTMLPMGLINLVITATAVALDMAYTQDGKVGFTTKVIIGAITLGLFIVWDLAIYSPRRRSFLTKKYRLYATANDLPDPSLLSR